MTHNQTPLANFANTNVWNTRQLVTMALMTAIGVVLSFIEIPLFPIAPWLKYDASAVCAMVCGFAFGAGPGVAVGVIGAFIHSLLLSDFWGGLMNIVVIIGFVVPASLIYKHNRTMKGALLGLVVSFFAAIILALLSNIVITPLYAGMPVEAVLALIFPILLPFNVLKALLNSILTLIVYKSISNLITPKKDQVEGR